jgi:hypothetical protein
MFFESKKFPFLFTIGMLTGLTTLVGIAIFGELKTSDKIIAILFVPIVNVLILLAWSHYWGLEIAKERKRKITHWEAFLYMLRHDDRVY